KCINFHQRYSCGVIYSAHNCGVATGRQSLHYGWLDVVWRRITTRGNLGFLRDSPVIVERKQCPFPLRSSRVGSSSGSAIPKLVSEGDGRETTGRFRFQNCSATEADRGSHYWIAEGDGSDRGS